MKYRLVISPEVESRLRHLNPQLKPKVRFALEMIRENPHSGKSLRAELKGLWSYRVSRYRIIYEIHHTSVEIHIVDFGPRNLIYERILELVRRRLSS